MEKQTPRLKAARQGAATVVELIDRKILDESSISQITAQLMALVSPDPAPRVVLDFANVSHMSSSALGMLITFHKRIKDMGGQLRLCNISPSIYEVFVLTRLNQVLKACSSRDDAVREANA